MIYTSDGPKPTHRIIGLHFEPGVSVDPRSLHVVGMPGDSFTRKRLVIEYVHADRFPLEMGEALEAAAEWYRKLCEEAS